MRTITEYLINKNTKKDNRYFVKDREELQQIISQRIEESENRILDLNDLNIYNVTDLSDIFSFWWGQNRNKFDVLKIDKWDTSHVTDMSEMFSGGNYDMDISNWNVSNVEKMSGMFRGFKNGKYLDLKNWNPKKLKNAYQMFLYCDEFNSDISNWDVGNLQSARSMFYMCTNFNQDLSKWNMSKVKTTHYMFAGCKSFNQDLSKWTMPKNTSMSHMFYECESLQYNMEDWGPKLNPDVDPSNMFDKSGVAKNKPSWYKPLKEKHLEKIRVRREAKRQAAEEQSKNQKGIYNSKSWSISQNT